MRPLTIGRGVAYSGTMSPTPLSRRLAALTISAVALLGLTACSGLPAISGGTPTSGASAPRTDDAAGDEGQSTADACSLVQDTITQATEEFENVSADDPGAVVAAMETAAQRIADASAQVTNDEVAALLPSLQDMFQNVGELMGALAEGDVSKLAEVEKLGTSFQETSQKFQELCAP